MTEPDSQIPSSSDPPAAEDEAQPFAGGPAALQGCGKPAIIGCLALLILVAIGFVVLVSQSPRILRWTMDQTREQIVAALPAEVDDTARQRLETAFDSAVSALTEGRVEPSSLSSLQRVASLAPRDGETLTPEQVEEITRLLEEIAGVAPPGAADRLAPRAPPAAVDI